MRRKRNRKVLKLVIIISFVIIFIAFISKIFVIQQTDTLKIPSCTGDFDVNQIEKLLGQNLLLFNKDKIEKKIISKYLCIKKINITKTFPNKLKLELIERQPKAVIFNINLSVAEATSGPSIAWDKEEPYLVDDEGMVFIKKEKVNLPKIYSRINVNLGYKFPDKFIRNLLDIYSKLNVLGMNANQSLLDTDWSYLMYSNPKVYFNLKGELNSQLASLQLILKEAKIVNRTLPQEGGGEEVVFVDLRFDKPIVRFAPKNK